MIDARLIGSQYWRFDPQQKPPIKSTYPKDISNWEGLPNSLDAAFQFTNGYSYFFKNGQYWRFNDRSFKVINPESENFTNTQNMQLAGRPYRTDMPRPEADYLPLVLSRLVRT